MKTNCEVSVTTKPTTNFADMFQDTYPMEPGNALIPDTKMFFYILSCNYQDYDSKLVKLTRSVHKFELVFRERSDYMHFKRIFNILISVHLNTL